MKLSLEHYNDKVTIETKSDDLTIGEVIDHLYGICIAAGFTESNVSEAFFNKGLITTATGDTDNVKEPGQVELVLSSHPDIEPYDGLLRDDVSSDCVQGYTCSKDI